MIERRIKKGKIKKVDKGAAGFGLVVDRGGVVLQIWRVRLGYGRFA